MIGRKSGIGILLLLSAHTLFAVANLELFDAADPGLRKNIILSDCHIQQKGAALQLEYGHKSQWPSIRFQQDRLNYPADWSGYALLGITLSNPTDQPVELGIRLDSADVAGNGRSANFVLSPGDRRRLLLPFAGCEPIIGMRGQPPLFKAVAQDVALLEANSVAVDPAQIRSFQIFMPRPKADHTLLLHRVELVKLPPSELSAFVDRFGQYNGADWPGKLHREAEFSGRIKAEQADTAAHPRIKGWNQYGGWEDGPQLESTGHFRVQKYRGKWWLVDPADRLFWSSGIDCVNLKQATIVGGREAYFEWLPEQGDPLAKMMSGGKRKQYNFFEANLYRKYGADYLDRFFEMAANRFCSWGINTIANWSDPLAWRYKKVPFTTTVPLPGVPSFVASSHMKAGLEKKKWFPDPFDPRFKEVLDRQLAAQAELKNDPWLLGVFVDNELPWRKGDVRIAALCLNNGPGFRIKQAVVGELQKKYPAIGKLNAAWGTDFQGWERVSQPLELSTKQLEAAEPDLAALDLLIARQYFRLCKEAMDRHLPGVLYLGCRFHIFNREIVQAASEYCDVISFNIYEYDPDHRQADELATELDFPVIIGEFHFGALDRGMFDPGLKKAKNQQDRAEKYAAYIKAAAEAPWCVGAHWFQYIDQPLTGRADGENYNIGFVDGTDDPYPELRDAARAFHPQLYPLRAK